MMGHPIGEISSGLKGHNDPSNMSDLRGIGESLMDIFDHSQCKIGSGGRIDDSSTTKGEQLRQQGDNKTPYLQLYRITIPIPTI